MAHTDWLDPAATASAACPAPMTRAALVALRAAAALRTECHYVVTDHVQGRLVAGTLLTLHAVSVNELSEAVEVNTTYDNEAWAGIYDIDRAIVLELSDNRGNIARGFNGTEVAQFDWGNTRFTSCLVDNATWTVTVGSALGTYTRVSVLNAGTFNTTGFSGTITDSHIVNGTNVNFTNATGTWTYNEWRNQGSFNASGYTGAGASARNEFDGSTVNIAATTGSVALTGNELSAVTLTAQGASAFTLTGSNLQSLTINRSAAGGAFTGLNLFSSAGPASITHTGAGAVNLTGVTVNGGITSSGAGGITWVGKGSIANAAEVVNAGAGLLTVNAVTATGYLSGINIAAGSNKIVTVSNSDMFASGLIDVPSAVAGGNFTVDRATVSGLGSYIRHRGTGTLTIGNVVVSGSAFIEVASGDRSYNIARGSFTSRANMILTGTGAVTDTIAEIDASTFCYFGIACSGAANSLARINLEGLEGQLTLTGTTGGVSFNRARCLNGRITVTNSTFNFVGAFLTAQDGGQININGVVAAKTLNNINATTNGIVTINNSTGGGTIQNLDVTTQGAYTCSAAAGGLNGVTVLRGVLSHDGGILNSVLKAGNSNLTTGNFNHTNIAAFLNANVTLTAANVNRQTLYTGGPLI